MVIAMSLRPLEIMMDSDNKYIHKLGHYVAYLYQYRNMYSTIVKNEFKGKFKNTIFGYFWHLLNPLTQIVIYYAIFTVIFGRDIPNYWVYISTGMFAYNFFSTCSTQGCYSVVRNSGLITKMTFAREILAPAKVTSGLITISISYSVLALLMVISGVGITKYILFVPLIVATLSVFNVGLVYILSAITVYIRDIANAVGIIIGCMMFAVPIMYVASQMNSAFLQATWAINPLYYYINCIHDSFYLGVMPDLSELAICILSALFMLIVGLCIFKKLEHGFAERL